jgi:hypothetical protein
METGRRDGNVTVAEYVNNDLPPPDSNIVDVKTFFSVKLLNSKDIAVLFGSCRRPTSRGRRAGGSCRTSGPGPRRGRWRRT